VLRTRLAGWEAAQAGGEALDADLGAVAAQAEKGVRPADPEEAVQESQARLRAAIESLPFDFFLLGEDGRYVMQNSACRQTWGDIIGLRTEDVCPDARTLALWQSNNRRAFAGEVVQGEVVLHCPTGERYCHNIISPIRDRGRIRGILGVNIDITARKRAEEALQRLNEELEDRVRQRTAELAGEIERRKKAEQLASLGSLCARVADEMSQPLTVTRLSLQAAQSLVQEKGPPEEVAEALGDGLEGVSDAVSLVEQWRKLAREFFRMQADSRQR